MALFFRIVQSRWAKIAMDGEGARLWGGRWNHPGIAAVYLAESRALAALEIIVHAPLELLHADWNIIEVEIPDEWIQIVKPSQLPGDWRNLPSSPSARDFGSTWLTENHNLALRLPSTIIPEEHILLIHPHHPNASKLKLSTPKPFSFDPRLPK
jgi:RES domain-containing protein